MSKRGIKEQKSDTATARVAECQNLNSGSLRMKGLNSSLPSWSATTFISEGKLRVNTVQLTQGRRETRGAFFDLGLGDVCFEGRIEFGLEKGKEEVEEVDAEGVADNVVGLGSEDADHEEDREADGGHPALRGVRRHAVCKNKKKRIAKGASAWDASM